VGKLRADTRTVMVTAGEINAKQALQMAVDAGDAPEEFLAADETPQDSLDDDDKGITSEEREAADIDLDGDGTARLGELIGGALSRKAPDPVEALIDRSYAQALAWATAALAEAK
jgi:hypothetical protein